jgi:hypothetical protein
MTELRTVYFKNAAGEVHPVELPALEAITACHKHPHEWSLDGKTFADPPEGFVFSEGTGGGLGRVRGASGRAN